MSKFCAPECDVSRVSLFTWRASRAAPKCDSWRFEHSVQHSSLPQQQQQQPQLRCNVRQASCLRTNVTFPPNSNDVATTPYFVVFDVISPFFCGRRPKFTVQLLIQHCYLAYWQQRSCCRSCLGRCMAPFLYFLTSYRRHRCLRQHIVLWATPAALTAAADRIVMSIVVTSVNR